MITHYASRTEYWYVSGLDSIFRDQPLTVLEGQNLTKFGFCPRSGNVLLDHPTVSMATGYDIPRAGISTSMAA